MFQNSGACQEITADKIKQYKNFETHTSGMKEYGVSELVVEIDLFYVLLSYYDHENGVVSGY